MKFYTLPAMIFALINRLQDLGIIDYLAFYNGKRTHSKLGYQSPLQFEREFYKKAS